MSDPLPSYRDQGAFSPQRFDAPPGAPNGPEADDKAKKPGFWQRFFRRLVTGVPSLFKGLTVTFGKFINPKNVVTQQYPENRDELELPDRFRGQVIMPHDEEGEHKCTGCTLCDKACPNGSISVLTTKNIAGKNVLGKYIYRWDQCTLCGLCVEACPYDAIRMGKDFEGATANKADLIMILNEKEGR